MKAAVLFIDEIAQVILTPETLQERNILHLFGEGVQVDASRFVGQFRERQHEYYRLRDKDDFGKEDSLMIVLQRKQLGAVPE